MTNTPLHIPIVLNNIFSFDGYPMTYNYLRTVRVTGTRERMGWHPLDRGRSRYKSKSGVLRRPWFDLSLHSRKTYGSMLAFLIVTFVLFLVKQTDLKGVREIYPNLHMKKILEEFQALQIFKLWREQEKCKMRGDNLPTTEDYDDDMDLYNWEAKDQGDGRVWKP
ncbi:hypothetical protein BC827DRAFT_1274639 [Russula dissimulans]|nr:hypothetical protein BC827DRAFT_1274639 [Russula dissimulans]